MIGEWSNTKHSTHDGILSHVNLEREMFIGIIRSNQGHLAISGQYEIYVNICANADSRKSILKFLSKTEKNGTNANFDLDSVDDFFLISFNCFLWQYNPLGGFVSHH